MRLPPFPPPRPRLPPTDRPSPRPTPRPPASALEPQLASRLTELRFCAELAASLASSLLEADPTRGDPPTPGSADRARVARASADCVCEVARRLELLCQARPPDAREGR